jgi:hypothetical protein
MVSNTLQLLQKQVAANGGKAGGRRVNRKSVPKGRTLAAKKAREEAAKNKNKMPINPEDMAAFKEKLAKGEMDDKLMELMKDINKENDQKKKKKNNVDTGEHLTDAQLDRKIKEQLVAEKSAFAKTSDHVNKVVAEVEAEEAKQDRKKERKAAKKAPKKNNVSEEEVAAQQFGVQHSKDIGNEHQGIKYNAAHYDGNDEEAEMLAALSNREHIRYGMGI